MNLVVKICRSCHTPKLHTAFSLCEGTADGLQYDCQDCINTRRLVVADAATTRFEAIRKNDPKNYDAAIVAQLYYQSRKRAKQKSLEHTISKDDIKLVHTCPIRCVELVRSTGKFSPNSYSLDRKDSTRGYVPGNVYVISWLANNLKSNLTVEDVDRLLKYMRGDL